MFSPLPVLKELASKEGNVDLGARWKLISVQHLMAPCGSMLESIYALGLRREHMYVCGKAYSTHPPTLAELQRLGYEVTNAAGELELGSYGAHLLSKVVQMWSRFRAALEPGDRIIILDDGGYVLKSCPPDILQNHRVFGIEQTSSGIWDQPAMGRMPVINVAASAAKTLIEPRIVAESVKLRIGELINDLKPGTVGVLGYGNVGKAIYEQMSVRYPTMVFDHRMTASERSGLNGKAVNTVGELYESADVILSSTGRDVSRLEWLMASTGDKTLISLSSSDVEFNALIRTCGPYLEEPLTNPLQTLNIRTPNGHLLRILRGGMVANFTGHHESGPGDLIQMTRGLLLSAVIQIARDHEKLSGMIGSIMLDPELQRQVMDLWLENLPEQRNNYPRHIIEGFSDIEWIEVHSKGTLVM